MGHARALSLPHVVESQPENIEAAKHTHSFEQEDIGESGRRRSSDSSPSGNRSRPQNSMDSSVGGSSVVLPTVVEESPGPRKSVMDSLPQPSDTDPVGEPPAEMAVRRGKNRFMTGEALASL